MVYAVDIEPNMVSLPQDESGWRRRVDQRLTGLASASVT